MIKAVNNRIQLIGFLGQELSQNADLPLRCSMATHERRKIKTKRPGFTSIAKTELTTVWHNLMAEGKVANEMYRTLSKGDKIFVEGRLIYDNTLNEATSTYHTVTSIEVTSFHIIKPS